MNDFLALQSQLESQTVQGRYINYDSISTILELFDTHVVGKSVAQRSIHAVDLSNGPIKILMWSQMHGNESTSTKALLDALCYLIQNPSLLDRFTLKIIPILNPDGAVAYTRTNSNGVDLNRDAINQTQPEVKLLVDVYRDFKPDYCFNLHDQRTIFGVHGHPCMLSFLSPAANEEKTSTPARNTAMGVIGYIQHALQEHIPNQVGRYDDSFNPNCMGDYFMQQETPTLLFEAGQVGQDYARSETRKWYGFSILKALECISFDAFNTRIYHTIPEVEKSFVDVLIRNLSYKDQVIDVALQFVEVLEENKIQFVPIVHKMGKLDMLVGHQSVDVFGKNFVFSDEIQVDKNAVWLSDMLNLTQYSH